MCSSLRRRLEEHYKEGKRESSWRYLMVVKVKILFPHTHVLALTEDLSSAIKAEENGTLQSQFMRQAPF